MAKNIARKSPRPLLPILAIVLILIGLIALAYAYTQKGAMDATGGPTATASDLPAFTESPTPSPATAKPVDEGVTWKATPEKLGNLGLIELAYEYSTEEHPEPTATYYRVGSDNGKDIVLALLTPDGPRIAGSYEVYRFLATGTDQYEFLSAASQPLYVKDNAQGSGKLTSKVTKKNPKAYKTIEYQPSLSFKGATLVATSSATIWFSDHLAEEKTDEHAVTSTEKYGDTLYGPLYVFKKVYKGFLEDSSTDYFLLSRPDGTAITYQLRPELLKDDGVPQITWKDGTVNKEVYQFELGTSCGSVSGLTVLKPEAVKDLAATGKTKSGEAIYEFTNKESSIVRDNYDRYTEYLKSTDGGNIPNIDEYLAAHTLFAYKDKLDRYILFGGGKYVIFAECGKPVIYLYPTETTRVSVQVDAKITVSDPDYGTGWNVTAQPNGKLTNKDGKTYDSLFWEGIGKEYPPITEGFVVAQKDIESTLRAHLKKLGLNEKESTDFMEFWLPKMPKTPYTRLTWFGTRQMHALAPLKVDPQPDTMIRIFLDFEGLQQPVKLPEQRLSTIARKGFTLVEWGGLLRK
jgi:hypothetical protein